MISKLATEKQPRFKGSFRRPPFNEQGFYAIVDLFAVGFVRDKARVFCVPNLRFLEKLVFPTLRRLRRPQVGSSDRRLFRLGRRNGTYRQYVLGVA